MLSGDHLFENGFEEDTLYRSEKSIMQELLADDTYFKVKKLIEFYWKRDVFNFLMILFIVYTFWECNGGGFHPCFSNNYKIK